MTTESITIPLRTGDVVLTNARQHGPERTTADRIVLVDPVSGASLSMPRDMFDRLADIGDVAMIVKAADIP